MPLISANDQAILDEINAKFPMRPRPGMHPPPGAPRGGIPGGVEGYRAAMAKLAPYLKPPGYKEADVALFDPTMAVRPGLTASVSIPHGAGPFPVMVHVHGHGLRAGHPPEYSPWIRLMSSYGFVVVFPDYRLQPEHSYEDQIDDVRTTIGWVRAQAAVLHADPDRMSFGGDSAAGALCFDLLTRTLADPAGPRFRAFHSVDSFLTGDPNEHPHTLMNRVTPHLDLPPIILCVGSDDEAVEAATEASTVFSQNHKPYETHEFWGMPHDFMKWPKLDKMHEANDVLMNWLLRAV